MPRIAQRITTASPIAALLDTDGYKLSHRALYPPAGSGRGNNTGTTRILINWTNRSNKYMPGSTHAVVFGVQSFIQSYLVETWKAFFEADEDLVVALYEEALTNYLGPNPIGSEHIRALHKLGYLPLKIKALPEGTLAPIGVATLTIENTHDAFYWLPNYIETPLSASIWHPGTVATIALEYRELLEKWALRTDSAGLAGVDFQAHDFSMRGQSSIGSAAASGAGHLTSFLGTDSMPAIDHISRYYPGDNGWVAASVPATEHSVMCVRGQKGELETFEQILNTFPTGIVSAVADGYDLFAAITEVLPRLKNRILARDGKLVIRPDSGDPVDIVTGEYNAYMTDEDVSDDRNDARLDKARYYEHEKSLGRMPNEAQGVVELLGDIFGYTVNDQGYKVLDPHIGVIYGDSINLDRALRIMQRLEAKGWASTNVVFGIGSFTYQMATRDNLGSAVKATWGMVDGVSTDIQKDPKTGAGGKKSAKGRIALHRDENGEIYQVDERTAEEAETGLLEVVWQDGYFYKHQSFADVRATLKAERTARSERNTNQQKAA